ncbi:BTA121 domain-containing protein surface lipoprotein [Borrelia persica]|uniref:BTA121 domain-containing protein surface lipoprotein n=1 Tax=Borrelia persica TaxID=44448 RepID=UPI0004630A5F|nr:hypothetical protein [Borrelia persica]
MSQKKTFQTIKEQLSKDEKIALNFWEDHHVRRNEDDFLDEYGLDKSVRFPYPRYSKYEFDYLVVIMDSQGWLKLALLFIMSTLNARAAVKYIIEDYNGPNKNIWMDRFKKETISYFRDLVIFTRGEGFGYTSDRLRLFYNELIHISGAFIFGNIAKDIINSVIIKQLDEDQKYALDFFEKAVVKSDYNRANPSKQGFYPFIAYITVDNLKRMLSKIAITLNTKKSAEQVLANYTEVKKDIFNKMLKNLEIQYLRYLGGSLNAGSLDAVYCNLSYDIYCNFLDDIYCDLSREMHVPQLKSVAHSIEYYISIINQLNDEEKEALDFFEGSITELNPDDPDDHKLITHSKEDFYLLLEHIGIDNLRFQKFLSDIVITLNAKKVAEKTIRNYDSSMKDMLIQKLRNVKASYIKYLKNICSTSSFDEIYNNLSVKTYDASQFANMLNYIIYFNIINQLSNEERAALAFLEDSVTTPNLDAIGNFKSIIHTKQTFYRLILGTDDVNKFIAALRVVATTLSEKKLTEEALLNCHGLEKDVFMQEFKEAETIYINCLRNICSTFFVEEMNSNLLREANYAYHFEILRKKILAYNDFYDKILAQLSNEEKKALDFLKNVIINPNLDSPDDDKMTIQARQNYNRLILNTGNTGVIDKLKAILSFILGVLNAKEALEQALAEYIGWPSVKDMIVQRLKDDETKYIRYLKTVCGTFSVGEFCDNYANVLETSQYELLFKSIVEDIKFYHDIYDQVLKKLNDDEIRTLTFLGNAVSIPDPTNLDDYSFLRKASYVFYRFCENSLKAGSIVAIKKVLSGISETLNKKETVERFLARYNGPDKDVLIKRFQDLETTYIKRLKTACDVVHSDDLYNNLLGTFQYGLTFESIVEDIKFYHDIYDQVLEKLNDDKMRAALAFLEAAISIPDLSNPDDRNMIIKSRQTFYFFCKTFLDADSITRVERALSGIVETLGKKETIGLVLSEYDGPNKNILTQKLEDIETEYSKHLKNICNHDSIYDMENSLLSNANNSFSFNSIETEVTSCNSKYISIISKLDEKEKRAFIFFKNSVIDPNLEPLDDSAMMLRIIQNFSRFLFNTDNVSFDNIKKAILSIVMTLRVRKAAEEVIEKYVTGSEKNMIERVFQVEEVRYKKYLKSIFSCDMRSSHKTICTDLMQIKYEPYLWEGIVNGTYRYYDIFSKISEQLSNEERDALAFLEDAITNLVPGNPDDHEVTIKTGKYRNFIVDTDNIDKLRSALLDIVLTLNAKKMAEKALVGYTGAGKNILVAKLEDTKAEYVRYLKSVYDTCFMCDHLSSTRNYVLLFERIVSDINSYSSIMEKLGDKERDALIFLEDSIMIYNPNDLSDYKITMDLSKNYSDFVLKKFGSDGFKQSLSKVVKTLKSKKIIEDDLKKYIGSGKDILEQRFQEVKAEYMKHLKNICNTFSLYEMQSNLLSNSDYSSQFSSIAISIASYKRVLERLDDNEKKALDFLEKSITRFNPDDSNDHEITMQAKRNYNLLILEANDVSKLKLVLSGIVATLNEKTIVEAALEKYIKIGKDVLEQKLRDIEVDYMKYLKNICNVSTVEEMKDDLLKSSDYSPQFEGIVKFVALYSGVLERLDDNEKKALDFLEKSITRSNPDDSNDHEITIQAKRNYHLLMLDANHDISKFKPVLLGVVKTLNANEKVKDVLKEYAEPGKDVLEQRFQEVKAEYMKHLKAICNMSLLRHMRGYLFKSSDYSPQFEGIVKFVALYSGVLERLDDNEKRALDFLEKCITKSNPDDSNDYEITIQAKRNYDLLMLDANRDISKFKPILLGIVKTLQAKEEAKDALQWYAKSGKDFLEQRFQEVKAEYMKHLKNICNTFYLYEMQSNLLSNSDYSPQFEGITKTIALYNGVLERLDDNEKRALDFLEKCITRSNPDDSNDYEITIQVKRNYDLLMLDANHDISKFKPVLLGIVKTLKAKEEAKNALGEYTKPGKDILEQRFQDAEAEYMKYLKGIFNTSYFSEMYNNLLRKTDNAFKFERILESINFYSVSYHHNFVIIMGQLDEDEQNALIFLEYAVTNPSSDDPNDHEAIVRAKQNYSLLMLYKDDISKLKLILSGIVKTLKEKKLAEYTLQGYAKIGKNVFEQKFQDIKAKYVKHLKSICNVYTVDEMKSSLLNNADHSFQFKNIVESINYYISIEQQLDSDEKNALAFLESVITIFNQSNLEFVTHTKYNFYIFILQIGNIDRLKAALLGIVKMLNAKREIERVLENYSGTNKEQFIQKLQKENINYIKLLKRVCNTYSFVKMYSDLLNRENDVLKFIIIDIYLKYYTKLIMKYNYVFGLQVFIDRLRIAITELLYTFGLSDEQKEAAMYLRKALVDTAKAYTNDTFYDLLSKLGSNRVKSIMNNMLDNHHLILFYRVSETIKNIQAPDVKGRLQDRLNMTENKYLELLKNYSDVNFTVDQIYANLTRNKSTGFDFRNISTEADRQRLAEEGVAR